MTALLRDCSPALAAAFAAGTIVAETDLFKITLSDQETVLYWTSWDRNLHFDGEWWSSRNPWIECDGWEVSNQVEVTSCKLALRALDGAFMGGDRIMAQIGRGLFDGATLLLRQGYMVEFGTILDAVDVFSGKIGAIDFNGIHADMTAKSKLNELDQYAPRNLIQVSCNHGFCDAGCGLSRASFTTSYSMGSSPGTILIPWASAPSNPERYQGGTLVITSGVATGARRAIARADSSGLTLGYPLAAAPSAGDSFTAFEGCDKSFDSGSVQSCTARSNTANYRGFEFVPPPTAVV